MNDFRVRIVLCCVPAIFANGCNSLDPCAEVTCDPNEVCVNGVCVECDSEEDCVANQTCVNGACLFECDANTDCAPGETCTGGICVVGVECESDPDCGADEFCENGTCFPDCNPDNCNDGNACTLDSCVGQACSNTTFACGSTANCPPGCDAACTQGICTD